MFASGSDGDALSSPERDALWRGQSGTTVSVEIRQHTFVDVGLLPPAPPQLGEQHLDLAWVQMGHVPRNPLLREPARWLRRRGRAGEPLLVGHACLPRPL